MNTEILGIIAMFAITLVIGILLGKYIANVYGYKKTVLDPIFQPIEKLIYKISGINPNRQMNWKQNMYAMLAINFVWFIIGFILLMTQAWLPLNPDGNPNMSPDLAFNTTISFLVNCNLQHYSGESGVSYLSQLYLMFLQFVTAATGMAAMAVLFKAFKEKTATELGNFYDYFTKSMIRILVPISIIVAFILSVNGTPMTFEGKDQITGLEGQKIEVSRGPVAGFVAIKHLGTNGGGFFGTNSAHPLENPNYVTNMTEMVTQMIIPFALVFALGFYLNRRKLSWVIFTVMTVGFLALTVPNIVNESGGNPLITKMGADSSLGAMEGKEIRFGSAASGYWSIATTVISTGSVNSMHDSTMPLSGMNELLAMMINCFYGGCGVGILNYFIFIILAVFISGLMVGRTPEFMGKKIEAKEMKIAMIVALFHPFLILVGTALTAYLPEFGTKTLNNPGFHGFSEMLYEFTSSSANNGSGFEGLGDNTPGWNISTGIVLLLSRFIPIIGPVAIAGLLAQKKFIPESSGTLKTDTATFGFMTLAVILLIAALSFFPALTLGPIAEQIQYFSK
ncbi:potassium-transporting ATPase subunit KdpA [Chryseobacterium indologenes]|uniref:potassium-transporting ATPase subunit KdpA n=1 Tax=Chryseobacterium indologenes TaxID=253 RepID=UPI000BFCA375|nr:potassium-transporting ATPase subunit KdpA [Chryseobacterium indologenes]ATN04265.1 potassium-transporting ATPase subunit KdpA [Chryseobacterium indologenes]AYY86985.1 potassium-transporting ATPase subunit KdpA [Chryseobacterium indologenes]QIX79973.1 potassium-transporting ATPase subunit KdpA [Chryseobacterium indologenes]UDQ53609.1 potassium-transporting ATPase subunit KdpA [Chryseobacterium indologenes]